MSIDNSIDHTSEINKIFLSIIKEGISESFSILLNIQEKKLINNIDLNYDEIRKEIESYFHKNIIKIIKKKIELPNKYMILEYFMYEISRIASETEKTKIKNFISDIWEKAMLTKIGNITYRDESLNIFLSSQFEKILSNLKERLSKKGKKLDIELCNKSVFNYIRILSKNEMKNNGEINNDFGNMNKIDFNHSFDIQFEQLFRDGYNEKIFILSEYDEAKANFIDFSFKCNAIPVEYDI